jgi:hypothetical protein
MLGLSAGGAGSRYGLPFEQPGQQHRSFENTGKTGSCLAGFAVQKLCMTSICTPAFRGDRGL